MRTSGALPLAVILFALSAGGGAVSCLSSPPQARSLTGTVAGAVSQGVTVTLDGAASATTTTDAAGAYAFTGLEDGDYSVTPTRLDYAFEPTQHAVTVRGADVAGLDFTATADLHAISGTVSGDRSQGVTVTLAGAASAATTTDASGSFAFAELASGAYTVTPSRPGFRFDPATREVIVDGADAPDRDFTAIALPVAISGTVSGPAYQGVTVELGGAGLAATTTSASGAYAFSGLDAGDYTVTPSRTGFVFTPPSRAVTVGPLAAAGQDFVSTPSTGATYYLTVAVAQPPLLIGGGRVTGEGISCPGTCTATFDGATAVVLTATAIRSAVFGGWAGCDSIGPGTCSVSMNADRTVTARFVRGLTLTVVRAGSGAGTVTGSGIDCGAVCSSTAAEGKVYNLTASPAEGSSFAGWAGCTNTSGATCGVLMYGGNRTVTATFVVP